MKTALYIRVSTEDQAKEGYSLEVQREYPPQISQPAASKSKRGGWQPKVFIKTFGWPMVVAKADYGEDSGGTGKVG
jgi:DNA invertase Pin-like site-specific DNA recombinase